MIPVDRNQCQGEKIVNNAFTIGGVPTYIRCPNKPICIVTENKPGADGQIGSMSLCEHCLEIAEKQLPKDYFKISEL